MHGPAKTGSVRFSTFQQSETGDLVPIQYWPSGRRGGRFQVTCIVCFSPRLLRR